MSHFLWLVKYLTCSYRWSIGLQSNLLYNSSWTILSSQPNSRQPLDNYKESFLHLNRLLEEQIKEERSAHRTGKDIFFFRTTTVRVDQCGNMGSKISGICEQQGSEILSMVFLHLQNILVCWAFNSYR